MISYSISELKNIEPTWGIFGVETAKCKQSSTNSTFWTSINSSNKSYPVFSVKLTFNIFSMIPIKSSSGKGIPISRLDKRSDIISVTSLFNSSSTASESVVPCAQRGPVLVAS